MKKLISFIALISLFAACKKSELVAPIATAEDIENITTTTPLVTATTLTTAAIDGNIRSDGGYPITERGIVYHTSPFPTIANDKVPSGAGIGSFTSMLTDLSEGIIYYARAYATSSAGTEYGNQVSFSTLGKKPTVTDCDGNIYNIVAIGSQVWLAENLKTTKYRDCTPIPSVAYNIWSTLSTGARTSYNSTGVNMGVYGQLYNWFAVTNSHGLAPLGWHVPNDPDWITLINYLGGTSKAGGKLKEESSLNWESPNKGATNSSGFTGRPGGYLGADYFRFTLPYNVKPGFGPNFLFSNLHRSGSWWSADPPWFFSLTYSGSTIYKLLGDVTAGFSVRCLLNGNLQVNIELKTTAASAITQTTAVSGGNITNAGLGPITARGVCYGTSPNPTTANNIVPSGTGTGVFTSNITGLIPGTKYYVRAYATNSAGTAYGKQIIFSTLSGGGTTVTDCDGNIYHTVTIGTQTWMVENLKTTKYRDCTPIPNVTDNTSWLSLNTGAYCNYNNDINNAAIYGRLYNWYAATDAHNIAPSGWHVPSDAEWWTLVNYLGGPNIASGKLREAGLAHWWSPNPADNSSGFTALPGGLRCNCNSTSWNAIGANGSFWTTTAYDASKGWCRLLSYNTNTVGSGAESFSWGFSIRCIKD